MIKVFFLITVKSAAVWLSAETLVGCLAVDVAVCAFSTKVLRCSLVCHLCHLWFWLHCLRLVFHSRRQPFDLFRFILLQYCSLAGEERFMLIVFGIQRYVEGICLELWNLKKKNHPAGVRVKRGLRRS